MSAQENKLVKTVTNASVLVGISAGVGWLGKKMVKDPSSNLMNYAKCVLVMSGSIYLKDYLESKNIIPV